MEGDFVLLAEKEAMWAEMLMHALEEQCIPCVSQAVRGAGFSIKTGIQDRLRIFVPKEKEEAAGDILAQLFPEK